MKEDAVHILFSILRSVFHGVPLNEEEKCTISDELISGVLKLAAKHDIAHLVAYGIMNNDMDEDYDKTQIKSIAFRSVHRYERTKFELDQICRTLENAQIPFIPLKGAVLSKYYLEL